MQSRAGNNNKEGKAAKNWTCAKCGFDKCWAQKEQCVKRGGRKTKAQKAAAPKHARSAVQPQKDDPALASLRRQLATLDGLIATADDKSSLQAARDDTHKRIEALQATKKSEVPLCYTEVQLNKTVKREQNKLLKVQESIAALEKEKLAIDEKIKSERERMKTVEERLNANKERVAKLRAPQVGTGWAAAVLHL